MLKLVRHYPQWRSRWKHIEELQNGRTDECENCSLLEKRAEYEEARHEPMMKSVVGIVDTGTLIHQRPHDELRKCTQWWVRNIYNPCEEGYSPKRGMTWNEHPICDYYKDEVRSNIDS